MITTGIKFSGDLQQQIEKFATDFQEKVVIAGTAAAAKVMYEEARAQAEKHKKSGLLQSAIYRVYAKDKSTPTVKTYRISWNKKKAPHGHLIEFGTSRAPAYPFIRPAFDRVVEAIEKGKEQMSKTFEELKGGK